MASSDPHPYPMVEPVAPRVSSANWVAVAAVGLLRTARHVLVTAPRTGMRAVLAEFRGLGGERSREAPLARGMAELVCALLEEDRAEALPDDENFFHLVGTHGLILLLAVIEVRAGRDEEERTCATQAGQMRWNRQFVELARAVWLAGPSEPGRPRTRCGPRSRARLRSRWAVTSDCGWSRMPRWPAAGAIRPTGWPRPRSTSSTAG